MRSLNKVALGAAAIGLALSLASPGFARSILQVKLAPNKHGTVADFQPMSRFCGTKKIKVALSDGWGGNYWRHITRGEFEA
ncbi:MAG: hypothetical protein ACREE3_08170, partial [Stellaceae bacterium]